MPSPQPGPPPEPSPQPPVSTPVETPLTPFEKLAPERIERAAALPPDVDDASRKARLWDEFTRVYHALAGTTQSTD